jgi:hypothetical protein
MLFIRIVVCAAFWPSLDAGTTNMQRSARCATSNLAPDVSAAA